MNLKGILWIIFGIIVSCVGLSYLSMQCIVSKPFQIQPKHQVETRFFVFFPGKYTLAIAFDRTKPGSDTRLTQTLGKFGCRKINTGTPCGSFDNYDFNWSIERPGHGHSLIEGEASPKIVSGGWLSRNERALGLAIVNLPFGLQKLTLRPRNGLTSLNVLYPKLIIKPGSGAKSTQSDFTEILVLAGTACFYAILPLVLIVLFLIHVFKSPPQCWFRKKNKM